MTPTSGDAPYVYTATFENQSNFDGIHYALEVRSSTSVGSCPAQGSGTTLQEFADSLLSDGSYTQVDNSVPSGSCRTTSLRIVELKSGSYVNAGSVNIDNT